MAENDNEQHQEPQPANGAAQNSASQPAPGTSPSDVSPAAEVNDVVQGGETTAPGTSDDLVKRIRTYRDDVASAVKGQDASVTSIAAAQAKKGSVIGGGTPAAGRSPQQLVKIALVALLVIAGVGAVTVGWYLSRDTGSGTAAEITIPSFFFVDDEAAVDVTGISGRAARERLTGALDSITLSLGSVGQVYPVRELPSEELVPEDPQRALLTSSELFEALGAEAPSSLSRALGADFMFGGHIFDGTQPLFVFRVNSYEQAFAGMLAWESSMSRDLEPLFGEAVTLEQVGTSTLPQQRLFRDEVIRNQDARILYRASGEPAILYVFPNRSTLIVTTNEHTLAEILTRLNTSAR